MEISMPRTRTLPQDGIRRTITLQPELDEELAVMAARQRVPLSTIIRDLIEKGLRGHSTPESMAVDFPPNWDGADIRERLYYLRMRQADLAKNLNVPTNTLNRWILERECPTRVLNQIMEAMKSHIPGPILGFKEGSRSPHL
jgi:DNA-binding transcriptional regulator YiaG